MHDNHVAHRKEMLAPHSHSLRFTSDSASANIMMDGISLYPKGFHPSAQQMTPSCKERAAPLERIHAPPVKYVFIDFGISSAFKDDGEHLIVGLLGRERAPELEDPRDSSRSIPLKISTFGKGVRR